MQAMIILHTIIITFSLRGGVVDSFSSTSCLRRQQYLLSTTTTTTKKATTTTTTTKTKRSNNNSIISVPSNSQSLKTKTQLYVATSSTSNIASPTTATAPTTNDDSAMTTVSNNLLPVVTVEVSSLSPDTTSTGPPATETTTSGDVNGGSEDGSHNHNNNNNNYNRFQSILAKIYEKIGHIDENRYVLPEYSNGEVPRIYSSLQFNRKVETAMAGLEEIETSEETTIPTTTTTKTTSITATHAAGSIVGSAALIAGTTIGAGVLALPTATVSAGFVPSTVAMGVAYGYMVVSGLLIAELTINRIGTTGKPGTGILDLFRHSFNSSTLSQLGTIAYFFLHYTLMVAYIAQGGNTIHTITDTIMLSSSSSSSLSSSSADGAIGSSLPSLLSPAIFASICGIGLYTINKRTMQQINNVLVIGVITSFVGIVSLLLPTGDYHALIDSTNQHPEHIVDCFPIMFLAFVYQNIVPTIVTQLEGDRTKIIYSIIAGTAIPFIMYFVWNAVILGNVLAAGIDPLSTTGTVLDPVALLLQSSGTSSNGVDGTNTIAGGLVTVFSTLAVLTSIIGFTYGLVEAWGDTFKVPIQDGSPHYEQQWKAPFFGLVFIPPVLMAMLNPTIFYTALEYGGAFGVSTLFLILPPIMVWNQRYGSENVPLYTKPMVPLGKIPLGSMWKAAGTLIMEQGAEKLGLFHYIQEQLHL